VCVKHILLYREITLEQQFPFVLFAEGKQGKHKSKLSAWQWKSILKTIRFSLVGAIQLENLCTFSLCFDSNPFEIQYTQNNYLHRRNPSEKKLEQLFRQPVNWKK